MDNIEIFKMSFEDIDDALALESTHNIKILSKNILKSDLETESNYYLVAKYNNKIIGYIGISYILDSADIISIVVDKNYTKRGIASLLLEKIYLFCKEKNVKRILLEVRKSNIAAQNLYLKNGFVKISERKKYYDNIEDAYIYQKELL
jgi:ribosomal-protein-alanine N-acetyltransferase